MVLLPSTIHLPIFYLLDLMRDVEVFNYNCGLVYLTLQFCTFWISYFDNLLLGT